MRESCLGSCLATVAIFFCLSLQGQTQQKITYKLDGLQFQADYTLSFSASKGSDLSLYPARSPIEVDFTGKDGAELVRVQFANIIFAEAVHDRRLRLVIATTGYTGLSPKSAVSKVELVSQNRNNGTKAYQMDFLPEEIDQAKLSFSVSIEDKGGEILGRQSIDLTLVILRDKTVAAPTSPSPTPVPQKARLSEDEFWSVVLSQNTEDALRQYLQVYPEGKYRDIANGMIPEIREKRAWASTTRKNSCQGYSDYLEMYPNGLFRTEANDKIKGLGCSSSSQVTSGPETQVQDPDKQAFENAQQQGSIMAYKSYLAEFPEGRYRDQAIDQIPFEVLEEDYRDDSIFSAVIAYVTPPLRIARIEVSQDNLVYDRASEEGGVPSALVVGDAFFWPEGNFKAEFSQVVSNTFRLEATLKNGRTYFVSLIDASGQLLNLEFDAELPSLEIIRVDGLDATLDTLLVEIKGGEKPYFARFVKRGKAFDTYDHEAELLEAYVGNYVRKSELLKNTYLTGGAYDLYMLDARKTQYKKYHLPVLFPLDAGVNPHLWQILAPILLLLVVSLIIYYRRSSIRNSR